MELSWEAVVVFWEREAGGAGKGYREVDGVQYVWEAQ